MISFFEKPVREVVASDVQELVDEGYPEGYELEFKQTLPDKNGKVSLWLSGKNEIGDYARDEILSEIVALANARGGHVVVGIAETSEKPPRASSIEPLPRLGELARRFEDQARACIDPPLPRLEIHPVIITGDSGVLVLHCSPSRSAPHRLTTTREAYVRRATSTVKMTMREIQDMTLNAARGLEGIKQEFDRRRSAFEDWMLPHIEAAGLRITAVPLEPIPDPGRLFGRAVFGPVVRDFAALFDTRTRRIGIPFSATDERPLLRGLRHSHHADREDLIIDQYQNGVMDLLLANRRAIGENNDQTQKALAMYHTWVMAGVATVLMLVDRFRKEAGAPNAEFGLEVEVAKFGSVTNRQFAYIGPFAEYGMDNYRVSSPPLVLPRIPIGDADDFDQVVSRIDTDMYDGLGVRRNPRSVKINW